ncbi:hypothetical protein LCGC14_0743380 [marine sediment metagenome]|uniref:Uncharacterized protein n=1 Tax=marine sediment metagenome TaxID=412755 RepID=A0A0F9QR77_9ZZZZ
MECPANCPVYKENQRLIKQDEELRKKHKEDIDKVREMLTDRAKK